MLPFCAAFAAVSTEEVISALGIMLTNPNKEGFHTYAMRKSAAGKALGKTTAVLSPEDEARIGSLVDALPEVKLDATAKLTKLSVRGYPNADF